MCLCQLVSITGLSGYEKYLYKMHSEDESVKEEKGIRVFTWDKYIFLLTVVRGVSVGREGPFRVG